MDTVGACGHCHTPRAGAAFNMEMYLAGHPAGESAPRYDFSMMRQGIFLLTAPTMSAFSGPFGTSFASNLTPDNETGLGGVDGGDVYRCDAHWASSRRGEQSEDTAADADEALRANVGR